MADQKKAPVMDAEDIADMKKGTYSPEEEAKEKQAKSKMVVNAAVKKNLSKRSSK